MFQLEAQTRLVRDPKEEYYDNNSTKIIRITCGLWLNGKLDRIDNPWYQVLEPLKLCGRITLGSRTLGVEEIVDEVAWSFHNDSQML